MPFFVPLGVANVCFAVNKVDKLECCMRSLPQHAHFLHMYALVTGGAGFIGSYTVELLLSRGACARVFDIFLTGRLRNLPVHERLGGGNRRHSRRSCRSGCNVEYLARTASGSPGFRGSVGRRTRAFGDPECSGVLNVLNAARYAEIRRVVHASSAAVYGIPPALPISESPPRSDPPVRTGKTGRRSLRSAVRIAPWDGYIRHALFQC